MAPSSRMLVYTVILPPSALPLLLDLAEHTWKHSTRLHATARAASARRGARSHPTPNLASRGQAVAAPD